MQYLDTWSMKAKRKVGVLTLAQLAQLASMPDDPSLISGLDPVKLARYTDTSHWNGKLQYKLMAPFVAGHMAKCSDGKQVIAGGINDLNTYKDDLFDDTCQQVYDEGDPLIAYHYWQPDHKPAARAEDDRQFSALMNALAIKPGKSVHGLRIDLEEKSSYAHTEVKNRLETFYAWCLKYLADKLTIDFYTSVSYLNSVPAVRDWIAYKENPKPVNFAQWVINIRQKASWADVITRHLPAIEMKVLNFTGWEGLQFTSSLYGMEGCGPGEIDINVHHGDEIQFRKYLNFTPRVVPPPQDPGTPPATEPEDIKEIREQLLQVKAQQATNQAEIDALKAWRGEWAKVNLPR